MMPLPKLTKTVLQILIPCRDNTEYRLIIMRGIRTRYASSPQSKLMSVAVENLRSTKIRKIPVPILVSDIKEEACLLE